MDKSDGTAVEMIIEDDVTPQREPRRGFFRRRPRLKVVLDIAVLKCSTTNYPWILDYRRCIRYVQ